MHSSLTIAAVMLAAAALTACGDGESVQFTQISAGEEHTCGLRTDGSVICWGSDASGQLGAPADERFTAITAGSIHTCGLREDGTSVCWGHVIDVDSSFALGPRYSAPFPPEDERFAQISANGSATCGLRADGGVACWELGWEVRGAYEPFGTEHVEGISAGGYSGVCARRADGGTLCETLRPPPLKGERFVSISMALSHACGLRQDGSVLCWGGDTAGQLSPPEDGPFSAVAAGTLHTCALRSDGSAVCWGYDLERAVETWGAPPGLEATWHGPPIGVAGMDWLFDSRRSDPPANERFKAIDAGAWHTCGLRQDGGVSCWGYNNHGQASPPGDS